MEGLCANMDALNISGKMTDMDFIIHVLRNLPEEYEVAVESLEDRLEDITNKLGIEEVCTKLNTRLVRINRQKDENDDELGFQAVEKGYPPCKNCGKHGHPQWICRQNPKNNVMSKSCLKFTLTSCARIVAS